MLAWIEGTIIHLNDPLIIKTPYSLGYEIYPVSLGLLGKQLGDEFTCYIYTYIKEDEMTYYGFDTVLARELFTQLISVSGIGPKIAMALMRSKSLDEIISGIRMQDAQAFTGVKGLGKKTAAKMVLMLQDKLELSPVCLSAQPLKTDVKNQDAQLALEKLGFSIQQIRGVLSQIPTEEHETSEVVRIALKELMTNR